MYNGNVKERAVDPSPCEGGGNDLLPLKHTNIELEYNVWYPESVVAEIFGKSAIVRARKNGEVKFVRAAGCYRYLGGWLIEWLDRVGSHNAQQAGIVFIEKSAMKKDELVNHIVNTQLTNAEVVNDVEHIQTGQTDRT